MFVEEFIEEIENPPARSRWKTRKVAKFRCDFCNKKILVRKNIKRKMAQEYVFCDKKCSASARKKNGILQKAAQQKSVEKYGVEHFSQRKDVRQKRKETFVKKYGIDNPSKLASVKAKKRKTCKKNWGVDNPLKSKIIREKVKEANIKKYGVEYPIQNTKIKNKIIETNIEKYGAENPFQVEGIKEKIRQHWINNYGVEHNSQTEQYKKSLKKTSLKKWGVEHFWQAKEIRKKIKATNVEKYGCQFPTQNKKVKRNTIKTNNEKYGVDFPSQTKEIKDKIKKTLLEKYGSVSSWKVPHKNITETGQSLFEWHNELCKPRPGYTTLCHNFTNREISIKELEDFINNHKSNKTLLEVAAENLFGIKHYNKNPKTIKENYRPDFKLSPRIFVNVDGLYWHSRTQKNKWYHFKLRQKFERVGLKILQFREDEIRDKSQIVKSIVNNAVGKSKYKIFGRKCKIKQLKQKEAEQFLAQNHLMGLIKAKHIGLYHQDTLVSIMSWKCRKNVCKIERFCSIVNTSVIGGVSKLLSHLEKHYLGSNISEIHNWVDLRYGTGVHLKTKGFELEKETLGWKWTDYQCTFNRLKCRANMDKRKLTQQEHADELGWIKIYDAGQRLWIKRR